MTDPNPTTVAVPVELLTELIEIVTFHKGSTPAGRAASALLPKPIPRLVAVDIAGFDDDGVLGVRYVKTQPDLLTLLDDVINEYATRPIANHHDLKRLIRTALGVTA